VIDILNRVPFVDLKAQYSGIREEMDAAVLDVLHAAHFVGGPLVGKFEQDFAAYVGATHCVGVANGTDAITLAARAAGLGPGDEVLVPANSFFASAEAISNAGATPVFVDVDPVTFHMDPVLAAAAITDRTRAILPVHLYGRAMNLDPFETMASMHDLIIIEDCAQAHGAAINGIPVGASGRLTCYSFYPGKNLGAYGDGGAVTTSDSGLMKNLRLLREHGSAVKYEHSVVGWNSRLDALQAAVLSVKLPYMHHWNKSRLALAKKLAAALEGSPIYPPAIPESNQHVFHLFVVRCSKRDEMKHFLEKRGIQTGIHYPVPLHLTGAYQALGAPGRGSKPVTEALASEVLSLPIYPELSDEQLAWIVAALQEFIQVYKPANPLDLTKALASDQLFAVAH
jgi:dTDP-4-amino-4,6-dideoxygalactose transaminase